MTDPVNNPSHYNQNGIEVIDVIETYAKDDFRLANVIKYVCRSGYKGNKLQDLQKAAWYLQRVLDELDPRTGYTEREVEVFFQGYDCREQEEADIADWRDGFEEHELYVHENATPPCTPYEEDIVFHSSLATRIAGDTPEAAAIKDDYYGFDRLEIKGYCANCDREIHASQPHLTTGEFEEGVIFCKLECMDDLRNWQRGLK